jgi:hypothetical protein
MVRRNSAILFAKHLFVAARRHIVFARHGGPRILLDSVSGAIAGRQFILSRSTASFSTNIRTFLNDGACSLVRCSALIKSALGFLLRALTVEGAELGAVLADLVQ